MFGKKKSTLVNDIIKQKNKILNERSKLANMELKIIYTPIMTDEMMKVREKVTRLKYEADKIDIPYELFLRNLEKTLKLKGE